SSRLTNRTDYSILHVPTSNIRWTCEDPNESDEEVTRCPSGTNFVKVQRGIQRALYVDCLASPFAPIPQPTVSATPPCDVEAATVPNARMLSQETERCGRPVVRILNGTRISGPVSLSGTNSVSIFRVPGNIIQWTCEETGDIAEESTTCAQG